MKTASKRKCINYNKRNERNNWNGFVLTLVAYSPLMAGKKYLNLVRILLCKNGVAKEFLY
jgi:hypothetical protein